MMGEVNGKHGSNELVASVHGAIDLHVQIRKNSNKAHKIHKSAVAMSMSSLNKG